MLISTTLLGPASLEGAKDALKTALPFLYAAVLVADPREEVDAKNLYDFVQANGVAAILRLEPWRDFSHARNVALRTAAEALPSRAAYDAWAMTLDADERMRLPLDTQNQLAQCKGDVVFVPHASQTYAKERFFRLPAEGRWHGPTHECFLPAGPLEHVKGASFDEVEKDDRALHAKLERDAKLLGPYTRKHPKDPRWHYYLGRTFQALKRYRFAIPCFDACQELRGWEEEAGAACFHMAECHAALGDLLRARDAAILGMTHAPWMPELPFMAAMCSYELDRDLDAINWARLATVHGIPRGVDSGRVRIGFRFPPAAYEGPFSVMAHAADRLGDAAAARAYRNEYAHAYELRTGLPPEGAASPVTVRVGS